MWCRHFRAHHRDANILGQDVQHGTISRRIARMYVRDFRISGADVYYYRLCRSIFLVNTTHPTEKVCKLAEYLSATSNFVSRNIYKRIKLILIEKF